MKKSSIQILQFGTGNFLRAFIEPMVQDLNEGNNSLKICIIQSTGGSAITRLQQQNFHYHLLVAGIKNGKKTENIRQITCVNAGLSLPEDAEKLLDYAIEPEVKWVVSNVTEAGMVWKNEGPFEQFAESFAGRLTQWLYRRFQKIPETKTVILPCELLPKNGDILKGFVKKHAAHWALDPAFPLWLDENCKFFNSLVDRIVPGFPSHLELKEKENDPFLVQTEPYCFWAIEGTEKDRPDLPFIESSAEVILRENIDFFSLRKIRILNGLHTFMAAKGLLAGIETVGDYMGEPDRVRELHSFLEKEIFPTLDAPLVDLQTYAEQVIDRFKNPFVSHKLADISLNSVAKFNSRLAPVFTIHLEKKGVLPPIGSLGLVALILFYLRNPDRIRDTQEVKTYFAQLGSQSDEVELVQRVIRELFGMEDSRGVAAAYQILHKK